jgi:AraC-like DNA-binding protein
MLVAEKKALLPKWRLKRVVEHVEAHLGRRVTLADMAAVAGLTRIYFAAQFRRTTGMSPHGYLLRRRVERAQELMRDPGQPLAQIALSVGFGTQPHFTTVFKRLVGQTPYRWRQNVELQTQQT